MSFDISLSFPQSQGSSCTTLNKVFSPTWMGHNDNTTYICDGSQLQSLWSATASPIALGIGTSTPVAGLDVLNPIVSSGGVAYGGRYQQTLTAAANGANLTALYINPTFTNGSYTGVANDGLIVASGNVGIGTTAPAGLLDVNSTLYAGPSTYNPRGSIASTINGGIRFGVNGESGSVPNQGLYLEQSGETFLSSSNNPIVFYNAYSNTQLAMITAAGLVGIGTTSPGALLDIGSAAGTLGTMRLEGNTSGYVQIQSAAAAGSWTMTLPTSAGTNGYVLQTNGSGVTSWVASSSGAAVASADQTAQGANIAATTLVTPGANTFYLATCYVVISTNAHGGASPSSTLLACNIIYTDVDSNTSETLALTSTAPLTRSEPSARPPTPRQ